MKAEAPDKELEEKPERSKLPTQSLNGGSFCVPILKVTLVFLRYG